MKRFVGTLQAASRRHAVRYATGQAADKDAGVEASAAKGQVPEGGETREHARTHFGNKTVDSEAKEGMVRDVFEKVSSNYDLMNDVMSAGMHRCWKDQLIKRLAPELGKDYLDVAGGSGDITFRILDALNERQMTTPPLSTGTGSITISDINEHMLEQGEIRYMARRKSSDAVPLNFKVANAEELPFEDGSFDAYTIAFGIRNVTQVDKALAEAYRVLRPGGHLLVLEFSEVQDPSLRAFYDAYSFNVIPVMGQVVSGDWDSYQYLVESIRKFPKQDAFADMIRDAGFRGVSYENLTFGVCAIHSGWKL
eukprot:TRINITY_DN21372_c0_g1_i1.p2 TRINITY_DN21372_c0_g1~~TRINITY_DN21372_c0_g1_i1.p2  ORF type:complete len:309 (+),score=118.69 TRINITY_DN21372_c0_g1_i1:91-1017(+)